MQDKILLCYSLLAAHVPLQENYSVAGCINAFHNEHVTIAKGLIALFNLMIFRERSLCFMGSFKCDSPLPQLESRNTYIIQK